jgi:hypothetical protein
MVGRSVVSEEGFSGEEPGAVTLMQKVASG